MKLALEACSCRQLLRMVRAFHALELDRERSDSMGSPSDFVPLVAVGELAELELHLRNK